MKRLLRLFRPHIYQIGDRYMIRKLSLFGFVFYDINDGLYWRHLYSGSTTKDFDVAKERLINAANLGRIVDVDL